MTGIGTSKCNSRTIPTGESRLEILQLRGLETDTSARDLVELLHQHLIDPVSISIQMDDRRRVDALIALHEGEAVAAMNLLNFKTWRDKKLNIAAWKGTNAEPSRVVGGPRKPRTS